MTEKTKKYISIFLTILMLLSYVVFPVSVFAQTVPTDTPTPDPTASVTTTPTPTPDPTQVSVTPTPTPDPTSSVTTTPTPTPDPTTPTPTPDPTLTTTNASNSADLSNSTNSSAITGDNTATGSATTNSSDNSSSTGGPSAQGGGSSTTQTGDAASLVNGQNSVNATSVNSNVIDQTINIYVTQNGDLNLSDPFTVAEAAIQTHPSDPVINVSFTNINNYTYLINNISSLADTGNNTANQSATINTGDAYSIVNLLNQVNFTVINSQIHIFTINIFGTLNGNIILPDVGASTNCSGCGVNLMASSSADVTNNLSSTANSGQNTATGSATITTGDASSIVNALNLINTNLLGTNAQVLFINVLGNWIGNFIGWGNQGPQQGGSSLVFFNLGPSVDGTSCTSCSGLFNLNLNSLAYVINNITSTANTGGNSLTGNGSITTGNAYSAISLINFINSNFINSFGFFGFINIFGNWVGNIGGASEFAALKQSDLPSNSPQTTSSSNVQQQGGKLQVTSSNNVGKFVYPGDTVTFFIKVFNPGSGKVYGTKLLLGLIKNGRIMGGTTYDLGDIDAQTAKNLTTGFVLTKDAPGGTYIAEAYSFGTVGPNNQKVDASSLNKFDIYGNFAYGGNSNTSPIKQVLGSHYPSKYQQSSQADNALFTLIAVLIAYMTIRITRQRKQLRDLFTRNVTVKEKLVAFRMFLL